MMMALHTSVKLVFSLVLTVWTTVQNVLLVKIDPILTLPQIVTVKMDIMKIAAKTAKNVLEDAQNVPTLILVQNVQLELEELKMCQQTVCVTKIILIKTIMLKIIVSSVLILALTVKILTQIV